MKTTSYLILGLALCAPLLASSWLSGSFWIFFAFAITGIALIFYGIGKEEKK